MEILDGKNHIFPQPVKLALERLKAAYPPAHPKRVKEADGTESYSGTCSSELKTLVTPPERTIMNGRPGYMYRALVVCNECAYSDGPLPIFTPDIGK